MEYKNSNKIMIDAYPDYECYALWANLPPTQEYFDRNELKFSYYHEGTYRPRNFNFPFALLDKDAADGINTVGCYSVSDDDRMLIHPKCRIPRKLISKGKVINEKSVETPNKIVVPSNYQRYLNQQTMRFHAVLMVNESAKIVLAVFRTLGINDTLGGTEAQWKCALRGSSKIYPDFGVYVNGFTMPLGVKQYALMSNLCEMDKLLLSEMFPKSHIISETDVPTGKDEPTADMLYSVYNMLKSPDEQIKITAVNMLAQSRFREVRHLVGWVLRRHERFVRMCRSKSTSVAWLYDNCVVSRHEQLALTTCHERELARAFVTKLTDNQVLWSPDGKPIYGLSANLSDASLRELLGKAKE